MTSITDIIKSNPVGSRIELTLKENVEFTDYFGPASESSSPGFETTIKTMNAPGIRVTGYVVRYDIRGEFNRLFLRSTDEPASRAPSLPPFYVMEGAIFNYKSG